MKKTRLATAIAIGATAIIALAGCSGSNGTGSGGSSKTLTVWLMQGTLTPASQKQVIEKFESQSGAQVKLSIQQWDNINTKLTTALATDTPPDVVEIGNTDVPLFAANGALADITSHKKALSNGGTWLTGLEGPATVDGKLYATPFYAGARGVIYNKQLWAAAGVTSAPKSFDEFTADLDKVAAQDSANDFSPIYMPGTYWYGGFSFVTDAGATIATHKGGKWTSGLTTPEAQKGLQQFKEFQNKYSTVASRTAPMDTPDPNVIFGTGKTSAINGNGNSLATILSSYPALKGQVSSFPIPSENHPGENAPTYLGGSDIAIAAKSKNQDLALKFIQFMSSPSIQVNNITKLDGHIPVTSELINKVLPDIAPDMQAFFVGAKHSYTTPAAPGWATIESDKTVLSFFSEVAAGTSTGCLRT